MAKSSGPDSHVQEAVNLAKDETLPDGMISDDDAADAMGHKREVDSTIAQELQHQEESYTEQIASLEIDNTKMTHAKKSSAVDSARGDAEEAAAEVSGEQVEDT